MMLESTRFSIVCHQTQHEFSVYLTARLHLMKEKKEWIVFSSSNKIRNLGFLAAIGTVLFAAPVLAAPGDFYTSYRQAKVISHLALPGPPPTQMFLQQQGRKEYLYVQQNGKQGFTVVDVSKPKRPKVVGNVPQQRIAALASGLAITEKAQPDSGRASAINGEGSRGGGSTPEQVRVLDVSNPAHPKIIQTFNGVTSIVTDNARGLVYVASGDGIWVLSHQKYLRRHLCSSSDAISSAEPNCD
jgi:LVIVD repeat